MIWKSLAHTAGLLLIFLTRKGKLQLVLRTIFKCWGLNNQILKHWTRGTCDTYKFNPSLYIFWILWNLFIQTHTRMHVYFGMSALPCLVDRFSTNPSHSAWTKQILSIAPWSNLLLPHDTFLFFPLSLLTILGNINQVHSKALLAYKFQS